MEQKVRDLRALLQKGLVVELPRGLGIEREMELIFPAKFEARFADVTRKIDLNNIIQLCQVVWQITVSLGDRCMITTGTLRAVATN